MKKRVSFLICKHILTLDVPNEASPLARYSLCFLGLGLGRFRGDIEKRLVNKSPRQYLK